MSKKRTPVGESRQETGTRLGRSSKRSVPHNWPDIGFDYPAPKGVLTWTGEPLKEMQIEPPKPKGKLDTSW